MEPKMDFKPFVFLVSADRDFVQRVKEALTAYVDLNIFHSGADFKLALSKRQPHALLIDSNLPDLDGYALHQAIRDDFDTSDIYQLLLCAETEASRDDMVADDFVLKPMADGVFLKKVALLKTSLENRQRASEQMSYAQSVAMTAMSSMGELGVVMEFMSKSFTCRSIQAVGELALNAIKQYELESIIYFTWEGESYIAKTDGAEVLAADREHIAQLRPLGRLLELNGQMVVNFEHTTILIRQLPDDSTRCGRLRDNIAMLCEGVEARVTGLLMENDNLLKQQGIRYAVCEIRDSVANLHQRQLAYLAAGRDMIGQVTYDFEDTFLHLGLMPEVENLLISQLVTLRQRMAELWSQPGEVEAKLQSVVSALEVLAGDVSAEHLLKH
jgi:DNA-binding response OmpR family regulator